MAADSPVGRRLAHLTAIFATAAAGFMAADAAHAGATPVRIIELPRVTVIGKRPAAEPVGLVLRAAPMAYASGTAGHATRIIELPRVVVVAKRLLPSTTVLAERNLHVSGG